MKLQTMLAGGLLGLCAVHAQAGDSFLEIINGTDQRTTTASNRVLGAGKTFVVGRLRSVLDLAPGQQAFVSFSFYGASAQGTDFFSAYGSQLGSGSSVNSQFEARVGEGLMSLAFGRTASVPVASNLDNAAWRDANFGIIMDPGRMSGWLLFEDARLGSDYDYDDMVVRMQLRVTPAAPVPEPSTIVLAAAGMAVVALTARRRRAKSQANDRCVDVSLS